MQFWPKILGGIKTFFGRGNPPKSSLDKCLDREWEELRLTRSSHHGSRCERHARSKCFVDRAADGTHSTPDTTRASCYRPPTGSAGRVSAPYTRHILCPRPHRPRHPPRSTGSSRRYFRCRAGHVDTGRAAASPRRRDDAARRRKIAAAAGNDDDDDDASASGGHRDTTSSLRHQPTLINRQTPC